MKYLSAKVNILGGRKYMLARVNMVKAYSTC